MKNNINNTNGWVLTDDDCLQYRKQVLTDTEKGCFLLVQAMEHPNGKYTILTDTINVYDYVDVDDDNAYEYLIFVLESYGYGVSIIREDKDDAEWSKILLKEFKETNGEDWKGILAECFFETLYTSADVIDSNLTWTKAKKVVKEYTKEN